MSVTKFGIYLAYAPTVDLRNEGLGRYLAAFLKGVALQPDVRFVLVCPSWSSESLIALFEEESVPQSSFEIVSPPNEPAILRLYRKWTSFRKRSGRPTRFRRLLAGVRSAKDRMLDFMLRRIATTNSMISLLLLFLPVLALLLVAALLSPLAILLLAGLLGLYVLRRLLRRYGRRLWRVRERFHSMMGRPKDDGVILRMYRSMEHYEGQRMQQLIEEMQDVAAWYSPTAFWPAFNKINKPRLLCVPDVVLTDFPGGFSQIGGDRFLQNFWQVEASIRGGEHYVTYSNEVKWGTLVDRYAVDPARVAVVHHAPNDLSRWIPRLDSEAAIRRFCGSLLVGAIRRSVKGSYGAGFENDELKFLFYASQLRPNKNLISLLTAYKHLLRNRLIGHKLILTGDPTAMPSIKKFVDQHGLQKEVLFLHGLKIQELAACYRLADLAVNPSLSEGGCPFTFTEALSVGTPVVTARIGVTEEVLTDPELQRSTFFDPYDWKDMANRIEWALANKSSLLALQQKTYKQLAQRNWGDVVSEHLDVLRRISNPLV